MSILLPPGVDQEEPMETIPETQEEQRPEVAEQEAPQTDDPVKLPEGVKKITILWNSKLCSVAIQHNPEEWHDWGGIVGVLEAAKTSAQLNHHFTTMFQIQAQQQQAVAQQMQAQEEMQRLRQSAGRMHPVPPGRRRK